MGSICSCFHVEDPGDSLNSSNGNNIATCKCPNCFLLAFFNKFAVFSANQNHRAVSSASNVPSDQDTITSQPITLPSDIPHEDLELVTSGDHNCQEHVNELESKLTTVQSTEWGLGLSSKLPLESQVAYKYESCEDEDVCPTCLEEYTPENPKIVTKCFHHYHLSCIYEWMERSSTCPVCGKEMIFDETT